jgi:hypothetical protein
MWGVGNVGGELRDRCPCKFHLEFEEKTCSHCGARSRKLISKTQTGIGEKSKVDEPQHKTKEPIEFSGNPEVLMRMLSAYEQVVFRALYKSEHAITVKKIQRAVVENLIIESGKKIDNMEDIPVSKILALARSYNLAVPSDATVKRALESLAEQGIVERRLLPEERRAEALYFINTAISEPIKTMEVSKNGFGENQRALPE